MSTCDRGVRRGITVLWLIRVLLFAAAATAPRADARQATPAAGHEAGQCNVAPRPFEEIQFLSDSSADEGIVVQLLPIGDPADPATTASVSATLAEMGACLTAGDMLRFYALHSDAWLRRFAEIAGLTTLTTSTPPLADGDRAVYMGPWQVQTLPDGRVMAATLLRVGDELRPDPSRSRVLVFIERDGQWLVDETIELVRVPGCDFPVEVAAAVGPPPGAVFDFWASACDEQPG